MIYLSITASAQELNRKKSISLVHRARAGNGLTDMRYSPKNILDFASELHRYFALNVPVFETEVTDITKLQIVKADHDGEGQAVTDSQKCCAASFNLL